MTSARIIGFGHYAPAKIVPNADLEQRLKLPSGWIEKRTGIRQRRFAAPDQAVTDLAFEAANGASKDAAIDPRDIGLVLLVTSTPDHLLPPSAPLLAHRLGCKHAGGMDLAGACTGFVQAFALADSFVRMHRQNVLVVAANILSRRTNADDATSSVLFGDGAGAVILAPSEDNGAGLLASYLSSRGEYYDLIKIRDGGSRNPFGEMTEITDTKITITHNRTAYARAIDSMIETSGAALLSAGLTVADIDWWVPHQANQRLIEAVRKRLEIPEQKTLTSVAEYANSSAATIPLTLSLHREKLAQGHRILMTAVGAGFTEGAIVFQL